MYISLTKFEIAEAQLHRAISLYIEGFDLISVVTLAGAADEILGKMNRAAARKAALDDQVERLCDMYEAAFKEKPNPQAFVELRNKARNAFKHFGSDELTKIDLEREACGIVSRAIENYKKLKPSFNKQFWEFEKEMLRRHREEQRRICGE